MTKAKENKPQDSAPRKNRSLEGNIPPWFAAVLKWREKHIRERNFIIFLAFIVGIL
ncbi:MAG: hypothetical protein HUK13_05510, partial [Muribaculaceae bacterium]|nr:hypothetical protein [Muribaculaceae bacterium]